MCKNLQGFPNEGGILDQDYEYLWAFQILDEAYAFEQQLQSDMKNKAAEREKLRLQLLNQ